MTSILFGAGVASLLAIPALRTMGANWRETLLGFAAVWIMSALLWVAGVIFLAL